jgi:hypothetical protein
VLGVLFREHETHACPEWLLDASLEFGRQQAGRGEGQKTLRFYKSMLRILEEHEAKILMGRKRHGIVKKAAEAAAAARKKATESAEAVGAAGGSHNVKADGEQRNDIDSSAASARDAAQPTHELESAAAGDKLRGRMRERILLEMVAVQMNQGQLEEAHSVLSEKLQQEPYRSNAFVHTSYGLVGYWLSLQVCVASQLLYAFVARVARYTLFLSHLYALPFAVERGPLERPGGNGQELYGRCREEFQESFGDQPGQLPLPWLARAVDGEDGEGRGVPGAA